MWKCLKKVKHVLCVASELAKYAYFGVCSTNCENYEIILIEYDVTCEIDDEIA